MPHPDRAGRKNLLVLAWLTLVAPITAFYAILYRESNNLPELDDYDAVLGFLNTFFTLHGTGQRLSFFLSSMHVQYKLLFEHLIFVVEAGLTGRVNFFFLQQLGNIFVLLIALVLWLLFEPPDRPDVNRLLLFSPVIFLVFSLQYAGTLDWAMGSLQNITVVFFALLCFYLLPLPRRGAFLAACLSLVCAIASSGNGFFVGLSGGLFLFQMRRRRRALAWVLLTAVMVGIYAYHYSAPPQPPSPHTAHQLRVILRFPIVFLGSTLGRLIPSLLLGSLLVLFALYLTIKQQWRTLDPRTFYMATFVLITALAVDYTRNFHGLRGAYVPRYRIYSQLSLAVLYMAALHLRVSRVLPRRLMRPALVAFAGSALFFCVYTDIFQYRLLHHRMQLVQNHYASWMCDGTHVSLVPDEDPAMEDPEMVVFRRRAVTTLQRSIDLGLYRPPVQPACR